MRRLILILFLLAIIPVQAYEKVEFNRVKTFDVKSPEDRTIQQVYLNNILFDGYQTIYFDAYGDTYTLTIKGEKQGAGWRHFWINITYPNSTTESKEYRILRPFTNDYDIKVQYYWIESDTLLDVDIYVSSLDPLTSEFDNLLGIYEFNTSAYLIFSEVSGISNQEMDVEVFLITSDELEQINQENILPALGDYISQGFVWTWNMVLAFVENVPVVGPYLSDALTISGIFIGEVFWWIKLFLIDNFAITVIIIEFFIIADAILSTRSLMALVRRIIKNHVAVLNFFRDMVLFMVNLLMGILRTVASIINALKPI
jgi:hypothetical protein